VWETIFLQAIRLSLGPDSERSLPSRFGPLTRRRETIRNLVTPVRTRTRRARLERTVSLSSRPGRSGRVQQTSPLKYRVRTMLARARPIIAPARWVTNEPVPYFGLLLEC
jgi:hypothetical protein